MSVLKVSICVVLYKAKQGTERFHQELLASLVGFVEWELLYYDNSPTDALREVVAGTVDTRVRYWHDPRNLGFSFANNQLILQATHSRVLLLNPDVYGFTAAHWIRIQDVDTSRHPRFARLHNADGSFQDCVGEVSGLLRALQRRRAYEQLNEPTLVGMGIMAFMLADKPIFARVGLLDCDYPLYAEDMDWCHRAAKQGMSPLYDPHLVLTHTGGASASEQWDRRASLGRKYRAERIFIDKHFRGPHWLAMRLLNALKRWRVRLQ